MGTRGKGNFFAVDRRSWARVCDLGLNAAVAYLVLACFSRRDNRNTTASVQAIMNHGGLALSRAKVALAALLQNCVLRQTHEGTRPRYDLVPAAEIPRLLSGGQSHDPEWIWLPNTLVTGAATELPPVARVRQTLDVMTLRLLIDLYWAQNLRDDGGINRACTWREYERVRIGERGPYVVWGFRNPTQYIGWNDLTKRYRRDVTAVEREAGKNEGWRFSQSFGCLTDLGLIEWIPCLFEGDAPEAEMLHPFGDGEKDSVEDRLGAAAREAAFELLGEGQRNRLDQEYDLAAPILRHLANATMIGVARLLHRPRTALTAAWWADLHSRGEEWIHRYEEIAHGRSSVAGTRKNALEAHQQHQRISR